MFGYIDTIGFGWLPGQIGTLALFKSLLPPGRCTAQFVHATGAGTLPILLCSAANVVQCRAEPKATSPYNHVALPALTTLPAVCCSCSFLMQMQTASCPSRKPCSRSTTCSLLQAPDVTPATPPSALGKMLATAARTAGGTCPVKTPQRHGSTSAAAATHARQPSVRSTPTARSCQQRPFPDARALLCMFCWPRLA